MAGGGYSISADFFADSQKQSDNKEAKASVYDS